MRNVVNGPATINGGDSDGDARPGIALDLAFLASQTFGDRHLEREVLTLFVEQVARLLPRLPELAAPEQAATAHLLKGSCQGIGAAVAADLLQRYDTADATGRRALQPELETSFLVLDDMIAARLAAP